MERKTDLLYAGIGSRATPESALSYIDKLASKLALRGFKLRSGAAVGADSAFERGAKRVGGACEIWRPLGEKDSKPGESFYPDPWHFEQASTVHPIWDHLQNWTKELHARNIGQILGRDGSVKVEFVACWTQDGAETEKQCTPKTGGTATAIKTAFRHGIPVYNINRAESRELLYKHVLKLTQGVVKPVVLNQYKLGKNSLIEGVYCGRGSPFGNPEPMQNNTKEERDRVCDYFEKYISEKPELISRVKAELKGKNLICFCAPCRCHCDTLLRIANEN